MSPVSRPTTPGKARSSNRRYSQTVPEPDEICEYYIEGRRSISAHPSDQLPCPSIGHKSTDGHGREESKDKENCRGELVRRELVYDSEEDEDDENGMNEENASGDKRVEKYTHVNKVERDFPDFAQTYTLGIQKSASFSRSRPQHMSIPSEDKTGLKSRLAKGFYSFQRLFPTRDGKQHRQSLVQFRDERKTGGASTRRSLRRRCLMWLLLVGLALLLLTVIGLFLLWPRRPTLRILSVEKDTRLGTEGFVMLTSNGLIQVNASSQVKTQVTNSNWLPITLRAANVTGWWKLGGGSSSRHALGSSQLLTPIRIARRRQQNVLLPFETSLWGDPLNDPLFMDYYGRCVTGQEREEQDKIYVDYAIDMELSYLGVLTKRHLSYSQTLPCPLGPEQVAEILRNARIDMKKLPRDVAGTFGRFGDSLQRALAARTAKPMDGSRSQNQAFPLEAETGETKIRYPNGNPNGGYK